MSVTEYNYRIRNTHYHVQTYFGVTEEPTILVNPEVYYPGYYNGIPTNLIPISEWNALTTAVNQGEYNPEDIPGDFSGFTNQATVWHTPLHIIASDNENYAIGISVVFNYSSITVNSYVFLVYTYTKNNPGHWLTANVGAFAFSKTPLESMDVAYNKQPEYIYLVMCRNTSVTNPLYPYPKSGGFLYTGSDDNQHFIGLPWSTDGVGNTQLCKILHDLALTPEENPDPQPTPMGDNDPYAPGGESWTAGGNGKFDPSTDDVSIPNLPTLSAASTGFITLFNPSAGQMRTLANYMWSGLFDIDTFRKIFANPMDCILGLSIVPVNVPSGGSASVMVGNIDTGISMTTASSQYVEVDCGSLTLEENYGSYLDYEPYTKAEIFLPYIGIHAISIDDIMGKTVTVKYHVDILSGACVAYVKCGSSVLYSYIGQCGSSIPISGNDWTNVVNGVLGIAGSVGSMVATGGASAPVEALNIASTAVNSMKPSIEKSGSLSGTGGLMGIQTPYLIITRPRQAIPARQNKFIGYPSFITDTLANIHGYTEVESIHLEGISATGAELSEIETILKGGVIL